jgi:hypothetical protein
VLASPPLIAAAVAVHLQLSGPAPDGAVARFLRGYAAGLIGRCSFAALFALLLLAAGVGTATLIATAVGCAVTLAVSRVLTRLESRTAGAAFAHVTTSGSPVRRSERGSRAP